MAGEIPTGPFDPAQVHAKLATGEVTWETPACPVGGGEWLPLVRLPGFGPSAAAPPAPALAPPPPARGTDSVSPEGWRGPGQSPQLEAQWRPAPPGPRPRPARPWDPSAIAWLGVLFTPPWAGVMAALNGRRLGSPIPAWMPLAIGLGALLADVLIGLVVDNSLIDALLYVGALGLLWHRVLRHQRPAYDARRAGDGSTASWTWPAVAGTPLALLAIFAFAVAPFVPLEPRQVCERFVAASSAGEAARYATLNMAPAVDALYAQKDRGEPIGFELTDEAQAPADFGGYLVGFRFTSAEAGRPVQMEGVFQLVDFSGGWKIEDMYFTSYDRQPLERWIRLSTDYATMLQQPSRAAPASATTAGARPGKAWHEDPATGRSLWYWLRNPALLKYLSGGVVAALAGISSLRRKPGPEAAPKSSDEP